MAEKSEKKNWPVITCPHCGRQFTPAEIFEEGDLIGVQKFGNIIRDALGKIIYQDFEDECEPVSEKRYYCDECGKSFIVEPVISFKVKKEEEQLDFSEQSVSLLD